VLKTPVSAHTSPNIALVKHVIVHKTGCVDHLRDLCKPAVLLREVPASSTTDHVRSVPVARMAWTTRVLWCDANGTHGRFMRLAVALATRKTITGRSFLPPAPKICSAAAMSIGWRLPTTFFKLVFINSISCLTGATAALSTSAGGGVATTTVGVGEVWLGRPFSLATLSVRAGVMTLRCTARLCMRWRCAILGLAELMRCIELEAILCEDARSIYMFILWCVSRPSQLS
jgi:hypothetical protein